MRRAIGPVLALLLALGVGGAIYLSAHRKAADDQAKSAASRQVMLRGMIGSEKEGFFADERVVEALRSHGLLVHVEKVGSRQLALRQDWKSYDFGFPAGTPAALKLQETVHARQLFNPFFTVMAVASWKPLIPALEANGLVRAEGGYQVFDMGTFLGLAAKGTRWRDLKANPSYATGKSVLINTTDVRTSNSGAMALSLASYVANGNNVIQTPGEAKKVLPLVSQLFLRQGLQETSTAGPFEDYVTMGMGKAPLVMVYEAQFLDHLAHTSSRNPDMVLLYPSPTIFTKHTLVPFTENGTRLGEALATDPTLQQLAAEYGLRTSNPEHFAGFLKAHALAAPATLLEVIDPPSYEMLEYMIQEIEKQFR
ncbi:MAG TPA: hypothetical protein VMS96_01060 [Terriglobales bacterium]|jgi:hypothetical protein|nr:hypothetical protein [Terriglobales bacterium]